MAPVGKTMVKVTFLSEVLCRLPVRVEAEVDEEGKFRVLSIVLNPTSIAKSLEEVLTDTASESVDEGGHYFEGDIWGEIPFDLEKRPQLIGELPDVTVAKRRRKK